MPPPPQNALQELQKESDAKLKATEKDAKAARKEAKEASEKALQEMTDSYEAKLAEMSTQGSAAGALAENALASEKEASLKKIKAMEEKVAVAEEANQKTQDQMAELMQENTGC